MKAPIRYAVVGLGYISQVAILPAFKNVKNSKLVALVSGDRRKRKLLGTKYKVPFLYDYSDYEKCLKSGNIDAVFIALPNHLHHEYAIKAAQAGIHVLCEKPMAVTSQQCWEMIEASDAGKVKLMVAYRLHFDKPNLFSVELGRGSIGKLKVFESFFSMPVKAKNIRTLPRHMGGGPLYDIGIYCINASRYLFQAEPEEVISASFNTSKVSQANTPEFQNIDETFSIILRFPGERCAQFVCSFGCADVSEFRLVGTKGHLYLENAYQYSEERLMKLKIGEKSVSKKFKPTDQFGPELIYFSDCILKDKIPEPSGYEGLADIKIIEAIFQSADQKSAVRISEVKKGERPDMRQIMEKQAVERPSLVHAEEPSKEEAA